jgi:uncharacterized GH25 family protein
MTGNSLHMQWHLTSQLHDSQWAKVNVGRQTVCSDWQAQHPIRIVPAINFVDAEQGDLMSLQKIDQNVAQPVFSHNI